jgi:16S rRNA (adenine1518-N6/adenine1519-N6)-dimethyltransferase
MKAKKHLGQNFLIDKNIINKIIDSIEVNDNDLIIEIGPGMGALTKELKKKGSFLLCYEIDKDLSIYLNGLEDNKTKIVYKDILSSNIKDDIKDIKYNNLYIIGNLPYYITTPIIKSIINQKLDIKEMLFMVQEEVADRFTAIPNTKDYGSITLYLKYYFNVIKLFNVSKKCFNPIPKVESAIIKFSKRIDKPNIDEEKYFQLINDSFKMKRKTLKNNLSNYDYSRIEEILNKYNLKDTIRAEEISEEIFIEIASIL